jgi:hypothetical protein
MPFVFKHYPQASVIANLEQKAGYAEQIPKAIQLNQSQQQIDASARRDQTQQKQFQQKLMAERFAQERDQQFRGNQAQMGRDANIAAANQAHQNRLDIQGKGFEHDATIQQEGFKRADDLTGIENMRTQATAIDSSAYETGDGGVLGSSRDQAQEIKDSMIKILNNASGVPPETKLKLLAAEHEKLAALQKATMTPSQQFSLSGESPSAENLRGKGIQVPESPYGRPGDQYEYVQNDDGSGGHWRATAKTQEEHAKMRVQDATAKSAATKANRDAHEEYVKELRAMTKPGVDSDGDADPDLATPLYTRQEAEDLARRRYGTQYSHSERKTDDDKKVRDLEESKKPRDRMAAARAKYAASTLMNDETDAGYYEDIRRNIGTAVKGKGWVDLSDETKQFLNDEYGIKDKSDFRKKKGGILGNVKETIEGYRRGNTYEHNHAAAFIEKYKQSEDTRARFAKAHEDGEGNGPERISDQKKIVHDWLKDQNAVYGVALEVKAGEGDAGEHLYIIDGVRHTLDELLLKKIAWDEANAL